MPRRSEPDPYASKIGSRLRDLRLERNMSLADLAQVADISKGHLSSVEHGFAAITIQTISRLAKGLGISAHCLLALPEESELEQIADLLRKLSTSDVAKLRRDLTKAAKEAAKSAKVKPARSKA